MPCQSPLQQITVAASKPSSAFLSNTMSQQQVSQHTPQLNSMAPNGGNGNQNNGLVTQSSQQQQVQQGSSQQPGGPGPKKVQNPRNQNGYNVKAMAAIKNDLNSYAKQPDHQAYQRPSSVLSTGSSNSNGVFSDATIYKDIQTLMQNFSIDEEASRKLLMNTGGRVDLAVEYLQRLEGVQPYINNSVLTQSNVAAFHQYSNGHAHRASPALNAQQQQQQRSESPSASGAPPLPPKPTMTDPRAPKVPPSVSHGGPTTNGVIDHPTLTRKYSPNNLQQQQQNGMNNHDVPPPLHPRRDANPNPPPTPPLPTRGTTPPPLPTQSSMVAQYSNSPGINTTLPALQRRMSPVPQVGGAYSRPQAGAIMVSSAVQRGTSPVTNGTPVRPHNTREAQTKVHQQLQAFSPNIFGPDNGTAEPPPPSYSQTLAAVNGNTNPPPPPPSYSQTMHMRQSPTLSSTSSVSDYSHINIRRSPAPGIGAPSNHSMMAVQGVPYGISQQQQMHHGPSPIPASPSPSISLMSGSSRASSSVQSRHIKTQSPVIMNQSSIVKSHQVQKPALQTATAVSKPIDGVAKPSMAKPLTKNIIMKPVPECSTPPLLNGAAGPGGGGGPAPPPPSYENAIIQHKKLNSPTTVPRNISPAITSQQISSPVNPRLPSPPPYPSSQVEQMKQQLVKSQPVINTAKVKQTLQRKYSPLTNSETTSSSASRSESPISDSQQTTISSSENTVSCSPLSFQENTLTQDSGFDQFSSLQNQFSSLQLQQNNATALMPPPPAVPHKTTHHTSPKPERRSLISEVRRSYIKNCDPQAYKFFMEQHYDQTNGKVWNYYRERKQRKEDLIKELENLQKRPDSHPSGFNADQFLNAFFKMESKFLRHKRAKWKRNDFRTLKILGQGAFGSVSLVRNKNYEKVPNYSPNDSNGTMSKMAKQNKNLFAMKTLNKHNVRQKNQVGHVIAERDILSEANNDWIVKLQGSFQDKKNLYFIMEYVPGGDLMEKLIRDEKFDEDLARFYIAELTLAVESVHEMDFIHRDIKPDNILIDREGHLKLTDFGLCTGFRWTHRNEMYKDKLNDQVSTHFRQDSMDPGSLNLDAGQCSCKHTKPLERRRQRREQQQYRCMAHSMVGTPNYIAPEVLSARSTIPNSGVGYNQSCDWWSVGVIFYEMIVGRPPFLADDAKHTQIKILEWRKYLRILPEDNLSNEATNLIMGLINDSDKRLEAEQIKRHPFFNGLQFDGIRNRPAPWVPALANDEDTSHFNNFDSIRVNDSPDISDNDDIDDHYANHVAGFTFKRFQLNGGLDPAHFESSNNSSSGSSSQQQTHAPPDAVYV